MVNRDSLLGFHCCKIKYSRVCQATQRGLLVEIPVEISIHGRGAGRRAIPPGATR